MARYIKKSRLVQDGFTILYDDRERKPWLLSSAYPMEKTRLKVGDYSIKDYEDLVAIEKKSGFEELFSDLAVDYRPTFKRFLRKLTRYPIRCIVIEDELSRVDAVYHQLKKKAPSMRMTTNTIFYWVEEIILVYCIPVLFIPRHLLRRELGQVFRAAYRRAQEIRNEPIKR